MRAISNLRDAEIEIAQLQDRLTKVENLPSAVTNITNVLPIPPRITKPIKIDKLDLGTDLTINTTPVNTDLLAAAISDGLKLLSGQLSVNAYGTEFQFNSGVLEINGVPLDKAIYETVGAGLIITSTGVKFGASNIENMVFNRSFEDGFEEWNAFGDYALNTVEFKSGVQSAEIKGGGSIYSGVESKRTISLEGDRYYARAWVKSTAGVDGTTRLAVRFLDSTQAYLGETSITFTNPETSWVSYEVRGTAPAGTAYVEAIIYSTNQTTGSWYVDDVYLTPLVFSKMLPDGVIDDGNMINSSILGDGLQLVAGLVKLKTATSEFQFVAGELQVNGVPLDKSISSTMETYFEVVGGKFKVKALGLTDSLIADIAATKITAGTLVAGVIYAGNITVSQIQAGTLAAGVILASNINATQINSGTLAAGVVYAGQINVGQINAGTLGASVILASNITASQVTAGLFVGHSLSLTLNGLTTTINNGFSSVQYAGIKVEQDSSGDYATLGYKYLYFRDDSESINCYYGRESFDLIYTTGNTGRLRLDMDASTATLSIYGGNVNSSVAIQANYSSSVINFPHGGAYKISNISVIDSSRYAFFQRLSIQGSIIIDSSRNISNIVDCNITGIYKMDSVEIIDSLGRPTGPGALFGANAVQCSAINPYISTTQYYGANGTFVDNNLNTVRVRGGIITNLAE